MLARRRRRRGLSKPDLGWLSLSVSVRTDRRAPHQHPSDGRRGMPEARNSTSVEEAPPFRYTAELANRIEAGWQERWRTERTFEAPNPVGDLAVAGDLASGPKTYVLDMFPY